MSGVIKPELSRNGVVVEHPVLNTTITVSTQTTTANTVLKTKTIEAGRLRKGSRLVIDHRASKTGTAGTFNMKIRFGGEEIYAKTGAGGSNIASQAMNMVDNKNATNVQQAFGKTVQTIYELSSTAMEALAVDTTGNVAVEFLLWCGNAGDTMNLESVHMKIVHEYGSWD